MNDLSRHRQKMAALESALLQYEQAELEVFHYFAEGTYTRELHLPAGTILTGKIHIKSCINIVSKGVIAVVTDEGEFQIRAPHIFVSGAGVKKAAVVIEDTIWINVHPWEGEADLELIEREIISPDYESLGNEVKLCLG